MLTKEASRLSVFFACESKMHYNGTSVRACACATGTLVEVNLYCCFYSREIQLDGCHQLCAWRKDTKPSSSESQGAYIQGTCNWAIVGGKNQW